MAYLRPGVYIDEISKFPPSVAPVSTAVPVFIGYTETAADADGNVLTQKAVRITSMKEYEELFGGPAKQRLEAIVDYDDSELSEVRFEESGGEISEAAARVLGYKMYYSLRAYFDNGGGPCYIFSFGLGYPSIKPTDEKFYYHGSTSATVISAITELEKIDEITLLIFPDKGMLDGIGYSTVVQQALAHAGKMKDRFALLDVIEDPSSTSSYTTPEGFFRGISGTSNLAYGAAYYPGLKSSYSIVEGNVMFVQQKSPGAGGTATTDYGPLDGLLLKDLLDFLEKGSVYEDVNSPDLSNANAAFTTLTTGISNTSHPLHDDELPSNNTPFTNWPTGYDPNSQPLTIVISDESYAYYLLKSIFTPSFQTKLDKAVTTFLANNTIELPATPYIAGVCCQVDRRRGVWKAPANVSLNSAIEPLVYLTNDDQASLNVDATSGKSINAIRTFSGKGILVWGARTLAGNDNEWRYIPVRRFFNFAEESIKKATSAFVFEPNDANTWVKVKTMITAFLDRQWQAGALQGAKPEDAFFVSVGLGETMTAQDLLEGYMIVEIGMAVVRPAEFIILKFSHKMPES